MRQGVAGARPPGRGSSDQRTPSERAEAKEGGLAGPETDSAAVLPASESDESAFYRYARLFKGHLGSTGHTAIYTYGRHFSIVVGATDSSVSVW